MSDQKKDGKGYEVRDRRMFDEEGKLREESAAPEQLKEEKNPNPAPEDRGPAIIGGADDRAQSTHELPPVDFGTLVLSIATSALLHLGDIHEEGREPPKPDLQLARHSIEIIEMLELKTKGNLSEQENKLVEEVLFDLRMRFVARSKGGAATLN